MDDPTDLALGIITGGSLAICAGCIIYYIIRDSRKARMKHSRSDTNLALNNNEEPVVIFKKDSDPDIDF
jgi:cbb3-type cytochrome oxidase subunit 3